MVRHIPNSITLLNLFCGCCAVVCLLNGKYTEGVVFIGASMIADFFDGFVARLLKVNSPLGVQLDSLADMVSFGFVPGSILYTLLLRSVTTDFAPSGFVVSALPAFVITLFSCLRLAKFNLDTRQTSGFIGLATPSNTLFFVGLLLIVQYDSFGWSNAVLNPYFLYATIPVFSYLMIAEIPMFSFKGGFDKLKIAFLAVSLLLLVFLREAALSFIVVFYVLINTFAHFSTGKSN